MGVVMAFVLLILNCMSGTLIQETLSNDKGFFESLNVTVNSLPQTMLISKLSTVLTEWVIQSTHFWILGGILMIKNFRYAIVRGTHLRLKCKSRGNTKDHIEWV